MPETVEITRENGVLTLALNRPQVRNALSAQMRRELLAGFAAAGDARCIVLTGSGGAFCSGQDLGDAGGLRAEDVGRILAQEYVPLLDAITQSPVPVIAAVNGVAAGAGANLALACDVVIAAESAVFVQAFTRIGLIPDAGGTFTLPRQVGMARAMGAMLFAEPVSARQAADWGMIWEAIPDADFPAHIAARAGALAAGPTAAYGALKQALRASAGNDMARQLALEADLQSACAATDDFREGVTAFLGKRRAVFTGR